MIKHGWLFQTASKLPGRRVMESNMLYMSRSYLRMRGTSSPLTRYLRACSVVILQRESAPFPVWWLTVIGSRMVFYKDSADLESSSMSDETTLFLLFRRLRSIHDRVQFGGVKNTILRSRLSFLVAECRWLPDARHNDCNDGRHRLFHGSRRICLYEWLGRHLVWHWRFSWHPCVGLAICADSAFEVCHHERGDSLLCWRRHNSKGSCGDSYLHREYRSLGGAYHWRCDIT